tara:strand:+ start:203 stop:571 length:369 start_codon:yes stop_codon:yes gene_type:complete
MKTIFKVAVIATAMLTSATTVSAEKLEITCDLISGDTAADLPQNVKIFFSGNNVTGVTVNGKTANSVKVDNESSQIRFKVKAGNERRFLFDPKQSRLHRKYKWLNTFEMSDTFICRRALPNF